MTLTAPEALFLVLDVESSGVVWLEVGSVLASPLSGVASGTFSI